MIKGQQLSIVPIDNKMRKKYIEYGHVHRRHFIDIEVESIRMEDVVWIKHLLLEHVVFN